MVRVNSRDLLVGVVSLLAENGASSEKRLSVFLSASVSFHTQFN